MTVTRPRRPDPETTPPANDKEALIRAIVKKGGSVPAEVRPPETAPVAATPKAKQKPAAVLLRLPEETLQAIDAAFARSSAKTRQAWILDAIERALKGGQ